MAQDTVSVGYTLNGTNVQADVEPRRLLVHHLRDDQGLKGPQIGCDTSQCGACTVLVDGRAVKSCTLLAAQAEGRDVVTIEGLAPPDALHPVQLAFREHHGLQCGYCTPGMVLTAVDLVERHGAALTEQEVREGLHGNLCRCTGYEFIVDAILAVTARQDREEQP